MACCGRGKPAAQPAGNPQPTFRATPDARYWADKLGVNLALVKGTGRDGLIRKEDVEAYAKQ